MKSPYDIDPVARYEVPFAPDNMPNDSGLIAKANKNGTMIVDKNIPSNSPIRKNAESHEDHHLRDMMDNKLDYDDKAVYHNLDGKGVKMVSRGDFQESDKTLPWEKDAYKAGDNLEEKDMRPNPEKLDGPPNMYEHDTPLSFVKQMGRERREQDQDKVSMSERFGMGMVKKFGCGPQANVEVSKGTDISGNEEGESEKEKLKKQAKESAISELELVEGKTTTNVTSTVEGNATDRNLVFKEITNSTTPSRGFKNKEESDWAKNNPEAYKKLIEQKREEESMKEFKQMPIRENPITVDSEMPDLQILKKEKTPPTRDSSISVGRNKVFDGSGIRKIKRAGRNFKTKLQSKKGRKPFKYKGNSYKCPY